MFKGHFYQLKPGWWIVSDTHFGHKNIIKYSRQEYQHSMDIDVNVSIMHEDMTKHWNSIVGKDDVVIHLGDVALGLNKTEIGKIIRRLNGTKMLIPGNHDRGQLKADRHFFNDCGFESVEVGVNQIEIHYRQDEPHLLDYGKDVWYGNVILSHEPIEHVPEGFINIHGHVHGGAAQKLYAMDSRRINVCWDAIEQKEGE